MKPSLRYGSHASNLNQYPSYNNMNSNQQSLKKSSSSSTSCYNNGSKTEEPRKNFTQGVSSSPNGFINPKKYINIL